MHNCAKPKFCKGNISALVKYQIKSLGLKHFEIKTFQISKRSDGNFVKANFDILKLRKKYAFLKEHKDESINVFQYKYPLGFFAGCCSFSFRVTFKEYKSGLKAAKFSLLLNQFRLNLDLFIGLVTEILVNNFPLEFYDDFFINHINDFDLKYHFLVVLRTGVKKRRFTKFYIIPKGLFIIHLREYLWLSLYLDFFFFNSLSVYYKKFKYNMGLTLLLIIHYVYKLIHSNSLR